jgi:hypothetical protein
MIYIVQLFDCNKITVARTKTCNVSLRIYPNFSIFLLIMRTRYQCKEAKISRCIFFWLLLYHTLETTTMSTHRLELR